MREIKFRGFARETSKWVFGFYSPLTLPVFGTMAHLINEGGYKAIEILETTLGQFTGLKDNHGKEIYEGDIVKYYPKARQGDAPIHRIEQVYWQDFRSGWATKRSELANNDLYRCVQYGNEIEVIGNVHENPELLS